MAVRLSVFRNLFDREPAPVSLPLEVFARFISKPRILSGAADKQAAPGWSPTRFNGTRANRHTIDTSCICLDFDDGATIQSAQQQFRQFYSIYHTSWSHTPQAHRFRLILPLSKPVTQTEFKRVWRWASQLSNHTLDKSCKDPARFWFLPVVHPNVPRHRHFWAHTFPGEIVHVPSVLATVPAAPARRTVIRRQPSNNTYANNTDRRALGERLGSSNGASASKIECPQCGDDSVYFYFDGGPARCNHKNTCGWSGPAEELI